MLEESDMPHFAVGSDQQRTRRKRVRLGAVSFLAVGCALLDVLVSLWRTGKVIWESVQHKGLKTQRFRCTSNYYIKRISL